MKLNSGNYLKTSEVKTGDVITFKNEGEWSESAKWTYDDGSPRKDFTMKVDWKGDEKLLRLNKGNRDAMIEAYGDETSAWIGKRALITIEKVMVGGKKMDCIALEAMDEVAEGPSTGTEKNVPF